MSNIIAFQKKAETKICPRGYYEFSFTITIR